MRIRKEIVVLLLVVTVISAKALNTAFFHQTARPTAPKFHSPRELQVMKQQRVMDPILPGEYFLGSINCRGCHGSDTMNYANVDGDGNDINIYDDWESTMMANSSKDPLWRAKVSHEILVNPSHSLQLQDKCTSCHAPMGHYSSKFKGNLYYTLSDLYNDTLGLDGTSCLACHMIKEDQLGSLFSGNIPYDTNHVIYGPFQNPITGPMQLYVNFTPTYSAHMSEGRVCSSCHTLLTESVDLSGNPTGRKFIEQATYHEWLNSALSADLITCQRCHMPQVADSVVIANGYLNMPPRAPFNRHKFMGGNEFMLKILQANRTSLGITVPSERFDSTIAITRQMLRFKTVNVGMQLDSMTTDTAYITVKLTNRAGHKFPSGYPSRRAVLEFVVVGSANDTIFRSGTFDENYEVIGVNPTFEPHYNIINNPGQAQIYEMVMGDVNGTKTTVLERGDTILKDNRIPPEGFVTSSPVYDTVKIVGVPPSDLDFNLNTGGGQGTGRDYVHYHVPIHNYQGTFNAYANLWYQPVPPSWLEEMFSFSSAEIDTFRNMYNNADQSPSFVGADSLMNMALGIQVPGLDEQVKVFPDPTSDGKVTVTVPDKNELELIRIYSINGQLLQTYTADQMLSTMVIRLPETKGTYLIEIIADQKKIIRKVIRS